MVIKGSTLNLWDDKKFLFTAVKYSMIQEIPAFLRNTCILAIYIDKRVWEILSPKTCIRVYNIHVLGFFPPHFSLLFLISMQISLNMFHSCLVKNKCHSDQESVGKWLNLNSLSLALSLSSLSLHVHDCYSKIILLDSLLLIYSICEFKGN